MPKSKNRQSELYQLARQLDMQYSPQPLEDQLAYELSDFKLTARKRLKRPRIHIRHLLRLQDGMLDYDLRVFDLHLIWGKNKRSSQTVFYMRSNRMVLPEFWMRPESVLHKIGEMLGREDIDFERFPRFSGRYRLTGDDEYFIRHHFNERLLHFFSIEKGWFAEGVGYYLLLYKKGKLLTPQEIRKMIETGSMIYHELAKATS